MALRTGPVARAASGMPSPPGAWGPVCASSGWVSLLPRLWPGAPSSSQEVVTVT